MSLAAPTKHHIKLSTREASPELLKIRREKVEKNEASLSDESSFGSDDNKVYGENLADFFNTQFVGQMSVGTPPQEFTVMFDTGSSNIWIPTVACNNFECKTYKRFNPHASSTAKVYNDDSVSIAYGIGEIKGILMQDIISLSGLTIENIDFLGLETMQDMPSNQFDGLIGMAFPALASGGIETFLEYATGEQLMEGGFSMYLNGNDSYLILGGVDSDLGESEFVYYDLISEEYWTISANSISFNGEILQAPLGGIEAIVDSGTSLLVLPPTVINKIKSVIGLESTYFPCTEAQKFPDIVFNIQGTDYKIPSELYVIQEGSTCVLGVYSSKGILENNRQIILGDVFLRAYYTHFDYENGRVGFTPATVN